MGLLLLLLMVDFSLANNASNMLNVRPRRILERMRFGKPLSASSSTTGKSALASMSINGGSTDTGASAGYDSVPSSNNAPLSSSSGNPQRRPKKRRRPSSSSAGGSPSVFAETKMEQTQEAPVSRDEDPPISNTASSNDYSSSTAPASTVDTASPTPISPPPPRKRSQSRPRSTKRQSTSVNSRSSSPSSRERNNVEDPAVQSLLKSPPPKSQQQQQQQQLSTEELYNVKNLEDQIKMPSLFINSEEQVYDRYAACLSATEGLRRARDAILTQKNGGGTTSSTSIANASALQLLGSSNPTGTGSSSSSNQGPITSAVSIPANESFLNPMRFFRGANNSGPRRQERQLNESEKEEYKRACAQYVLQCGKVIKSLGLTVSQFNQLGREVGKDPVLKERVMEQAYLYRMAATVHMSKIPLIEDPNSTQLLKSHRRRRVQMFVRSITEIEDLREEQTELLKKTLNIEYLPPGLRLSDPNVLPILSPQVRAVVEQFPVQAESIVKKYGLNSDEFNQMLEETRGNPVFRWRVKKYMQKYDDLVKGFEKGGFLEEVEENNENGDN